MRRKLLAIAVALLVPIAVVTIKLDVIGRVREIGLANAVSKSWNRVRRGGVLAMWKTLRETPADAAPTVAATLSYSLFDSTSWPAADDYAARAALPEYTDVPAVDVAQLAPSRDSARTYENWHRSGGDEHSSKYSSLAQITVQNVRHLEPAWSYASGADIGDSTKTGGVTVETNPVVVGNHLFVSSIDGALLSLDAATGKERWRTALPPPVAKRGLVWEPSADFATSRLFVPTGNGVTAVNAATGKVIANFGRNGVVGSGTSLIAPLLVRDRVVIATLAPAVEAFDRASGALLWTRSLLDTLTGAGQSLSGGAPWGGMSADTVRNTIFVTTGNPRPALIGSARPGDNRYSCSVIAIDASSGAIRWSFQEVAHDLWDLDIPTAPILTTITRNGRRVDVIAVLTKRGNTLLLDRDGGKPIFGYRMKRAPASNIPGERTAAYQPVFTLPEPYARQEFSDRDVTDLSPTATRAVTRKLRNAEYGFFRPPVIGKTIAYYGIHGGVEWPGGAVDPTRGILYVPSNEIPWVVRTAYLDMKATAQSGAALPGNAAYQSKCARCHGGSRGGSFEWEGAGDKYLPALTGITLLRSRQSLESSTVFAQQHEGTNAGSSVTADELRTLYQYFATLDTIADRQRSFGLNAFWQLLLDDQGYPGNKPPWGLLTALDLNSGKKLWQIPFGQLDKLQRNGAPVRGLQNQGGVTATAGGVLFATGTTDNKVRAYDAANGAELWSYQLPAAGSTIPTTYTVNGTQYVVVVATGGVFAGFSGRSDRVIAFRLPASQR